MSDEIWNVFACVDNFRISFIVTILVHQWTVKIVAYYVMLSGIPNKKCANVWNNIRRRKKCDSPGWPGSLP
jgi:hypothetical protein